ncbi:putative oxidoreductase SadH [wastewater metagenome]|uniref:Putative oxidoreductase SadH n=2 Tax=unclassified sequences TaxID=12908 RepID=A0A5B8R5T8_9ZZZZ|nr:SDR family oxidoreductase [Arhodomonas sp. KWT]QEA03881.1 putative oxidoreductase SadH [uncultured organism]
MQIESGRTAFVTGGGAGIGLAVARTLLDAGMNVAVADLSRAHLDEARAHFEAAGPRVRLIELDVTDRDGWAAAVDEAEAAFGPIHLLYNNAGVNVIRDVKDATAEDFEWVMGVNYGGTVNGVLTLLPRMKAHGGVAHIVNTSSIAGIAAGPGAGVYAASKFAIRGFSDALRCDVAPYGIAVSLVCPGTVATRLYESEDHRQARFQGIVDERTRAVRAQGGELFRRVLPQGMDPAVAAARVRAGIEREAFYIFTHPEVRPDVEASCAELTAAFTDDPVDPDQERLEEGRRQARRDALNGR